MGTEAPTSNSPIPIEQLSKIATEACDSALADVQGYEHSKVNQWSSEIINKILQSLISATSASPSEKSESSPASPTTQYRFNVTCTIIQQSPPNQDGTNGSIESSGRRGMHTASGAYWDVTRDGMWTFKYPRAEEKGMDLVLSVVWFGTSR